MLCCGEGHLIVVLSSIWDMSIHWAMPIQRLLSLPWPCGNVGAPVPAPKAMGMTMQMVPTNKPVMQMMIG
jgi:hypothetical protein